MQFFDRNSQDGSPRCGFGTHSVVRLAVVPLSGGIAGSACASPVVNIRKNSESCAHQPRSRRTLAFGGLQLHADDVRYIGSLRDIEESELTRPEEILASRRWDAALFTTYAFSISFFESVVLRALQKSGCRDVWVLTDTEGYAASLIERRATKVGRDYRLIPIHSPKGVFHPKCTYLASQQGDVLLVGSGNLTFGGYGRNVEVLDVLVPDLHPEAFSDFASFLEALGTRPDLAIPETTWVSLFASMARHAGALSARAAGPPGSRLLHSVEKSIIDQVAELISNRGRVEAITILSPFHDPDGAAVHELARRTECPQINIALPPDPKLLSAFPFPLGQRWNVPVQAVRPSVEDATRRPLHAKWIDIKTTTGLLRITGSINATTAALCSTRNVEVGVLRQVDVRDQGWESVPIPTQFDRKPFTPGLLGERLTVHASLSGASEIRGRIIPASKTGGVWQLILERLGDVLADLAVQVDDSGAFRVPFAESERLISAGAVRVSMKRAGRQGAGWLEMEELLRMPTQQRTVFAAMVRFMTNQANDQDDIALLDYLAMSAARHVGGFKPGIEEKEARDRAAQADERADVSIRVDRFAPDERSDGVESARFLQERNGLDILDRWFNQFRRRVLSPARSRNQPGGDQGINPIRGSAEDEEEATDQQRVTRSFDAFHAGMIRTLNTPNLTDADIRTGLAIWFDVSTHMFCHRMGDISGAMVFLRSWLSRTAETVRAASTPTEIERYTVTVVAILAGFSEGADTTKDLRLLHEILERFCGGTVSREYAMAALDRDWAGGVGNFLCGGEDPDLEKNLDVALGTKTTLTELQDLLETVRRHDPVPKESPLFFARDGQEDQLGRDFRAALLRADKLKHLCERRDESTSLSCCKS